MFQLSIGRYSLRVSHESLPTGYGERKQHAELVEEHELTNRDGTLCCIEVGESNDWPFLVVAQRYEPSASSGFFPGALIVPETATLFLGAGTRLLAYDLEKRERLWYDVTQPGFWSWARHGDVIVMSAELELAAWDLHARRLWSRFVEPPWSYEVIDGVIHLDVMGAKSVLDLHAGAPVPTDAGGG